MTGADLVEASDALALEARASRVEVDQLSELALPAVLHWGLNHFVVLEKITSRGARIVDPSIGRIGVSLDELDRSFTGVAFEFRRGASFSPIDARRKASLLELWRGEEPVLGQLSGLLVLAALLEVFALATPLIVQRITDSALSARTLEALPVLLVGLVAAVSGQSLGSALRTYYLDRFRARLNLRATVRLFDHLLRLPIHFFHARHVGDIQSRFGSLASIHASLSSTLVGALFDAGASVLLVWLMMTYSVSLTLVILACVAAYMLLRATLHAPTIAAHEQMLHASARKESFLLESFRGAETIKMFARIDSRVRGFEGASLAATAAMLKVTSLTAWFQSLGNALLGISLIATIGLGASAVSAGELSVGMFVALVMFRAHLVGRVVAAFDALMQIRMLDLHVQRVSDISQTPLPPAGSGNRPFSVHSSPRIALSGVHYQYPGTSTAVVSNLSFEIQRGESVALIGPSGCGKSTVAKLIAGLLTPNAGKVSIDGIRVSGEDAIVAHRIAIVAQHDAIFSGSIAENVAFDAEHMDLARVEKACRDACILSEIQELPMGLHSHIGDNGTLLSGGQRQRVLIARALYLEPSLLILDEATSHLDADTERKVVQSLKHLCATRIHIAHRAETIRACDRVIDLVNSSSLATPASCYA